MNIFSYVGIGFRMRSIIFITFLYINFSCMSQAPDNMAVAADKFIRTLSGEQKIKAQISFDQDERYNWHFFPKTTVKEFH